ncbi:MAG TPA: GGDEF domain-containing protein [Myxococcaceae bacterium]|nr:GGDEF domain-containing protein [Myxococcaceae bacterium]
MTKGPEDTVTEVVAGIRTGDQTGCACLLVISGNAIGRMFKLTKAEMIAGRGDDVDIFIDDVAISRHHARILMKSEKMVLVEDLGSKNGTFVGHERVDRIELREGDRFQLGPSTILKLTYQDNIEQEFQRHLYESATRDGLTGLFNKKFLLDRLTAEFAYCTRHLVPVSLCLADVDHFKQLNDQFGHLAGDAVLTQLARVVSEASRTEDILCRYGGEEFAVLLREIDERNAALYAERIRRRVEQSEFAVTDQDGARQWIKLTISVGVATQGTRSFTTIEDFIAFADKHLYQAKRAGRNRVSFGIAD